MLGCGVEKYADTGSQSGRLEAGCGWQGEATAWLKVTTCADSGDNRYLVYRTSTLRLQCAPVGQVVAPFVPVEGSLRVRIPGRGMCLLAFVVIPPRKARERETGTNKNRRERWGAAGSAEPQQRAMNTQGRREPLLGRRDELLGPHGPAQKYSGL